MGARAEVVQRWMGRGVSPFPVGVDRFFWNFDQEPQVLVSAKEEAKVTFGSLEGKNVLLVETDFATTGTATLGQSAYGHVFLRQWVYKGYKSIGEEWSCQISSGNILRDIGLADKMKLPLRDEPLFANPSTPSLTLEPTKVPDIAPTKPPKTKRKFLKRTEEEGKGA